MKTKKLEKGSEITEQKQNTNLIGNLIQQKVIMKAEETTREYINDEATIKGQNCLISNLEKELEIVKR